MDMLSINRRWFIIGLCMVAMAVRAGTVHIIPLWFDNQSKAWQLLVGRNIGTATWTDFDATGTDNPISLAQSTLKGYTRGRYNEENAPIGAALRIMLYGQQFFFVPVLEKLDEKTMRKARNSQKTEFTWVPIQQVIGFLPVYDSRKRKSGRISVDVNFRALMRLLWPEIEKKFYEGKSRIV